VFSETIIDAFDYRKKLKAFLDKVCSLLSGTRDLFIEKRPKAFNLLF